MNSSFEESEFQSQTIKISVQSVSNGFYAHLLTAPELFLKNPPLCALPGQNWASGVRGRGRSRSSEQPEPCDRRAA